MAIQRGDSMHDLVQLRESLNRVFEEALGPSSSETLSPVSGTWRPPLDLFEDADSYIVRADLPGVPREEVAIEIEDERLVIRGERRTDRSRDGEAYLRVERPAGPFSAEIALPASIDRKRIQASHRNGVLEIVLPKKKDEAPSQVRIDGD